MGLPHPGADHVPEYGETEYTGVVGPAGVPKYKKRGALTPSEEARLLRLTGTKDPKAEVNYRIWEGETAEKTRRQKEGDRHL